ncbi:hypothetical protein MNB_SV-15-82 [hydrothermal vent metagenome]|uniref:Uncharacterized protein n=1 Tax=hydrothermal vent metagenome TaxID=652676 RepID=A0A1W1EI69_9ZZZZ
MKQIFIDIHEVWLETLMAGFASKKNKVKLFDSSDILFRHFTWVENALIKSNIDYNYNRGSIPIKVENFSYLLNDIIKRVQKIIDNIDVIDDKDLRDRILSDLNFIIYDISLMEEEKVTAFNTKRELPNIKLQDEARDALTIFLFEESYKEYELIMIYNYLKANSNDAFLNRIFAILIDESFFHLKSFGQMMSDMGILAVPRIVNEELYKITDITKFLKDGINEEINAKEECRLLSEAVSKDSDELAKFFDLINNQENYHISLMKEALEYYAKS